MVSLCIPRLQEHPTRINPSRLNRVNTLFDWSTPANLSAIKIDVKSFTNIMRIVGVEPHPVESVCLFVVALEEKIRF